MKSNRLKYCISVTFFLLLSQIVWGQLNFCDYNVVVDSIHESTCFRNGVVYVKLTGPGIDSGHIDADAAVYGLEAVSPTPADKNIEPYGNNGVIMQVAPGTYLVKVMVTCDIGLIQKIQYSDPIIISGSYNPPNPISISKGGIVKPYKCDSSGIIPVTVSGGNPPYRITVTDNITGFQKIYDGDSLTFSLTDLPKGDYQLSVTDACNYFPSEINWKLEAKEESFKVGNALEPVFKCDPVGKIPVTISEGKSPYTVSVTGDNGYVWDTIVNTMGTFNISHLPIENYSITIKDACGNGPAPFLKSVTQKNKNVTTDITHSNCRNIGEIYINLSEAKPPFTISVTADNGYTKDTVINSLWCRLENLYSGDYTIKVKDACDNDDEFSTLSAKINGVTGGGKVLETIESHSCGPGTGKIRLGLTAGGPYAVNITYNGIVIKTCTVHNIDTTFHNLKPGSYDIEMTDIVCGGAPTLITGVIVEAETFKPGELEAIAITCAEGYNSPTGMINLQTKKTILPLNVEIVNFIPLPGSTCTNLPSSPILTTTGNIPLTGLCPGTYKIRLADTCYKNIIDTIVKVCLPGMSVDGMPSPGDPDSDWIGGSNSSICEDPDPKNCGDIPIAGEWSSFNCPSGSYDIYMNGGSGYYELSFIQHPDYPLASEENPVIFDTVWTPGTTISIKNLPPGNYTVLIKDSVSVIDPVKLDFKINSILDINLNVFEDFVYSGTESTNCKTLRARLTDEAYNKIRIFFADKIIRVVFNIIGTTYETDVISIDDRFISFELPENLTYQMMRDASYKIGANIGLTRLDCEILVKDTLRFDEVKSTITRNDGSCAGYNIYTQQSGLLCYPCERKLYSIDDLSTPVMTDQLSNNNKTLFAQSVPFGKYKIFFTDASGYQWVDSIEYLASNYKSNPRPLTEEAILIYNKECGQFNIKFPIRQFCGSVEWKLINMDDETIIQMDTVTNVNFAVDTIFINTLKYGTNYKIVVKSLMTDESIELLNYKIDNKRALLDYEIKSVSPACLPDTAKGYMYIERAGSSLFSKGTRFEFIQTPGLTLPEHDTIVMTGTENILYPFSRDNSAVEHVKLAEGTYMFRVMDTCGFTDTVSVDYKTYKVLDFAIDVEYRCNDALLKPVGHVVLGDSLLPVSFRLIEWPAWTLPTTYNAVVHSGDSIQLTVTGHYKLQASVDTLCYIDTLVFDYRQELTKVAPATVTSYICNDDGFGYISFLTEGGVGDIAYTLIIPGKESIKVTLPQGTPFTYNQAEKDVLYVLQFRDTNCSGAGGSEEIRITNFLKDKMIIAPLKACPGRDIELYCEIPDATYKWTFPDGVVFPDEQNKQNPVIPNATLDYSGEYSLEISNVKGCLNPPSKTVYVEVGIPDAPTFEPVTYACIDPVNDGMATAIALPGYILEWYNKDSVQLTAPTYSRAVADTFDFLVSQHNTTYCYSNIVPLHIIVEDSPVAEVLAYADEICHDDKPIVIIPENNIKSGYIYRVFNRSDVVVGEKTALNSDILRIQTSEAFTVPGNLYLEVETNHGCISNKRSQVAVPVINPDTVAAISANICPEQYPKIKIETTIVGYTYNIYTEAGDLVETMQGNGDSIFIVVPEAISVSTNYFVETVNTKACASADKTRVRTEVVNYMYINPDAIPEYKRDIQYSFQLETNAVSPYIFSTDDRLASGFSMSDLGLISGIAARNGTIDPVPFTVKVVDINGCFASKEYVLESDIFVPQVFTPNGDGKNDVFMKGHHVRIFDRMGLKIYESLDGWNGTTQTNSPATGDTYFYTILGEKQEDLKKGAITLIRR